MTDLDDLRAQLQRDAASVTGAPDPARLGQVQRRIRAIRRRRHGAMAVAVAAVVAAVAVGVPVLVGRGTGDVADRVPEHVTVLGFDYTIAQAAGGVRGGAGVTVELPPGDLQRVALVSAAHLPDGSQVTLFDQYDRVVGRLVGGGAELPPVPIDAVPGTLRVAANDVTDDTVLRLTVYERTDVLPEGITNGTAVYRQQVGGATLVEGGFLPDGASSVSFQVEGPLESLAFSFDCARGADTGVVGSMAIDGDTVVSGRCGPRSIAEDAGTSWTRPGNDADRLDARIHTVTIFTSDRVFSEESVPFDGVEMGVGIYRAGPAVLVSGAHVDQIIEANGRLWKLEEAPGRRVRLAVTETDEPRLIGIVAGGGDPLASVGLARNGRTGGTPGIQSATGWSLTRIVWPGQSPTLTLVDERGRPADGSVLVYRPLADG
ncbi:hypothetical protein [Nocardioides sp. YIM 152588]|uniref:hypothetical protein n=1 Tax=Nocardioides sp. YIM 152588 TaxID=3158259 RepID=UPI0032E4932A